MPHPLARLLQALDAARSEVSQLRSQLDSARAEVERLRQDASEQLAHLRREAAAAKAGQDAAVADAERAKSELRFKGDQYALLEGRLKDAQRQVGAGWQGVLGWWGWG